MQLEENRDARHEDRKSYRELQIELSEAKETLKAIRSGDVDVLLGSGPGSSPFLLERLELVEERNLLLAELKATNKMLKYQKEEYEYELKLAESVQRQLLPSDDYLRGLEGVDVAAHYVAASAIGGDIYDVFPYGDNRYAFMIADITGHGPSAALIMVMMKTLVDNETLDYPYPATLAHRLNEKLLKMLPEGHFITMFFAVADLNAKTLTYVTAGHPPPVFVGEQRREPRLLESTGELIGIIEMGKFAAEERTVDILPGDKLLLYTDGAIEMHDGTEELYGIERLIKLVHSHRRRSGKEIADTVMKKMRFLQGDRQATDDIAVMAVDFG